MKLLLTFLFVAFCLSSKPPVSGHSLHDAEVKEKEEEHMDLDDSSFFDLHDTNRDGVLTKQEIRAIMSKYYDDTDLETTVNENMNFLDLNKDGVISKDEFLNGMDRENRGEHPDFSEEHHDNTNTYHSNSGSSHNKESLEKHFGTSSYQNIPEKFRIQ